MTYATTTPVNVNGLLYASSVPLTATEADLFNQTIQDPINVLYGQAIAAIVQLVPSGGPTSINAYVAMQMDMGDGVWVDVAWCVFTNPNASATFILSGGVAGANSVQQVRQTGSFPTPQANGSNQVTLAGRIRFVGKSLVVGGSSVVAGQVANVAATIRYKLLGLR